MNYKIGLGIDIHELIPGSSIKLAGVDIPAVRKIKAHSDGDIIYHSLSDGILGALSKGDIGMYFPDNDQRNKDLDSSAILLHVYSLMSTEKYSINNIDITIVLEKPKINNYKDQMRKNISLLVNCDMNVINIKATTSEQLGFVGKGEGIMCHSIVSIISK